ncbi:hypothetical protein [Porphyromonas loveana]|uniref:hypothetical protein n=1 Tax=Porphyromonas loveana TaxID=1884669 RepID=UPI0035A06F32
MGRKIDQNTRRNQARTCAISFLFWRHLEKKYAPNRKTFGATLSRRLAPHALRFRRENKGRAGEGIFGKNRCSGRMFIMMHTGDGLIGSKELLIRFDFCCV